MVRLLAATDEYQDWLRMAQFSHGVTYLPTNRDSINLYNTNTKGKKGKKIGTGRLADFGSIKTLMREYPKFESDNVPISKLCNAYVNLKRLYI